MPEKQTVPPSVPEEFNLDAWIDGTCGLTRVAKVYQRGDLLAKIDVLKDEFEIARKIPKDQRGVSDRTPEAIQDEWDQVAKQVVDSQLLVHIQDRTEQRRRKIRERMLTEKGIDPEKDPVPSDDEEEIFLNQVADAIVKIETSGGKIKELPDGMPPKQLIAMKNRLGDSGLYEVAEAFRKVTMEAPSVAAPLSQRSSSGRGGVT